MVKPIKFKQTKRGVTLIELVLYMGIFTILVCGILYSAFYLQKVLEYNAVEYTTQEQIYGQLNLLQHHMDSATSIELSTTSLKITNPYGYIEQYLQDGLLHMTYTYPSRPRLDIIPYPYAKFEKFSFTREIGHETLLGNSVIWVDIERWNLRGRVRVLKDYLIGYKN